MFKLIPRVRVNYTLADLFRGFFAGRGKGKKCKELRLTLSRFFEVDDVLLTSSGRASIYILLRFLPQSKVIVPAYTCKVVVEAAMLAGKKIIYAPTSRKTFNVTALPDLDTDTIVIATHQYGLPCDIVKICEDCKNVGAIVIEDCAGALGTKVNGKFVGTFGDYGIFSFDSSKMLTIPSKGGFIIAKNSNELKDIDLKTPMHNCTISFKMKHLIRGFIYVLLKNSYIYRCFHYITMARKGQMQLNDNVSMDVSLGEFYTHSLYEWQAAVILRQIRQIDDIIVKRKNLYKYYDEHIHNKKIEKPMFNLDAACIRYAILVKDKKEFYEECVKHGVDMGFSFNHLACSEECREEQQISDDVLNLPYYYNMSEKEQSYIVNTINSL